MYQIEICIIPVTMPTGSARSTAGSWHWNIVASIAAVHLLFKNYGLNILDKEDGTKEANCVVYLVKMFLSAPHTHTAEGTITNQHSIYVDTSNCSPLGI